MTDLGWWIAHESIMTSGAMMTWNLDECGSAGICEPLMILWCVPVFLQYAQEPAPRMSESQVIAELQDRLNTEAGRLEKSALKVGSPAVNICI